MTKSAGLLLIILNFALTACVQSTKDSGDHSTNAQSQWHTIQSNNTERNYLVYSPNTLSASAPLVIFLHGGLGNADQASSQYQWTQKADQQGFLVAFANGTRQPLLPNDRRTWNAGTCCGYSVTANTNDVLFLQDLIVQIKKDYPVDSKKIYLAGFSNGAMLSYKMLCEAPENFAAIGVVAGTITFSNPCNKGKDVPVFHIHGSNDQNVLYAGGLGSESVGGGDRLSIPDVMTEIGNGRTCSAPQTTLDTQQNQSITYSCSTGADLQIFKINNGTHIWPLDTHNATTMLWNFFSTHSQP